MGKVKIIRTKEQEKELREILQKYIEKIDKQVLLNLEKIINE